jgi:hypothetical protein
MKFSKKEIPFIMGSIILGLAIPFVVVVNIFGNFLVGLANAKATWGTSVVTAIVYLFIVTLFLLLLSRTASYDERKSKVKKHLLIMFFSPIIAFGTYSLFQHLYDFSQSALESSKTPKNPIIQELKKKSDTLDKKYEILFDYSNKLTLENGEKEVVLFVSDNVDKAGFKLKKEDVDHIIDWLPQIDRNYRLIFNQVPWEFQIIVEPDHKNIVQCTSEADHADGAEENPCEKLFHQ